MLYKGSSTEVRLGDRVAYQDRCAYEADATVICIDRCCRQHECLPNGIVIQFDDKRRGNTHSHHDNQAGCWYTTPNSLTFISRGTYQLGKTKRGNTRALLPL